MPRCGTPIFSRSDRDCDTSSLGTKAPITPGTRVLLLALASATPTTEPRESSTGPPEDPPWMLAVVRPYWPISWPSPSARCPRSRVVALNTPVDTKLLYFRGVPSTIIFCPGISRELSPKTSVLGAVTPATFRMAMSIPGSTPSTVALTRLPSYITMLSDS